MKRLVSKLVALSVAVVTLLNVYVAGNRALPLCSADQISAVGIFENILGDSALGEPGPEAFQTSSLPDKESGSHEDPSDEEDCVLVNHGPKSAQSLKTLSPFPSVLGLYSDRYLETPVRPPNV